MQEKNPERTFIHDLSSPLAVLDGSISTLIEDLEGKNILDERQMKKLDRAVKALEKMREIIQARRAILLAQDSKGS